MAESLKERLKKRLEEEKSKRAVGDIYFIRPDTTAALSQRSTNCESELTRINVTKLLHKPTLITTPQNMFLPALLGAFHTNMPARMKLIIPVTSGCMA